MKNVSNDTMQVLLDHFQESFADSPGIAQMIYGHIIDAMENVPEDKQDDFIKAISSLTFGNLDSVLALQDTLKSFEIDGDFTSLINNISRLAQSTTEASTNLTGLYEIIEKIGNGETVFSDEEYKELLGFGANESDFMQDLEGNYIYIGENLGQLLADTTANAYDVQLQSYRNAIEKGDMATAEQNLVNMETLRQQQLTSDNYQQVQQGLGGVTEKELIAAASRYEELTDDIEKYRKAMQSADKEERTRATLVLRNAVLGKAQEKQFNNLTEAISENKDALLSGDEASQAYRDALGTVTKAAQEFFGEVVDDDFVSEHVDLFAQMAEGDVNALESIRDFIAQDLLASFEAPEGAMANVNEEYANLVNYLAQLDGSEFTVDGHMDDSEIVAKINALINSLIAAGATADQVKAVVEGMGYTIDWDIEYEQIPIYTNVNAKYDKEDAWTMDPSSGKTLDVLKGGKYISVPKPTMKVKSIGDNAGKNWTPPKASGGSGGSGGGGGGSEKNDIWENPYDELYNLTEKVNEALRDREKLERDYDRILKNRKATSQELINNSLAEISNLRHEIDLQRQLLTGRRKQLAALGSETHADSEGNLRSFNSWGVTKYASYNEKTGLIEIDWEGIDAITDTELGEAVEAYVSRVEELAGQIEDIQDTMEDMKDKIDEIKERNKDNYLELEQRVYDALVNQKQALIDEYQAISDSISESNNKIIDSLRESIDLERQIRDNTKTEEDLADKEARLAYLRRDTSGANQTEILKLEKELEEGRQSYQDKLIDQAIDKLDQENQRAADQREKQIQLMQDQLDWQASQGEFWKDTYTLLSTAFDENGNLKNNSELVKLLKEDDTFKGLSMFGQENWIEDMARTWLEAQEGLNNWRMQKAEEAGSLQLNGNGTKLTYKNGKWYDSKGNEYENVHWDAATQTYVGTKKAKTQVPKSNNNGGNNDPNPPKSEEPTTSAKGYIAGLPEKDYNQYTKEEVKKLQEGLLSLRDDGVIKFDIGDGGRGGFADGVYGNYTKNAVRALQTLLGSSYTSIGGVVDGLWGKKSRKAFLGSKWKAYKTGGLADFTGPAWLDGSLTNPEMVLNPQDTHNFLSLVDMLRNLAASGQTLNDMSFGDYLFNITVNAELNNDYDVDRLVDRLKDRISSEAQYRNINAMSRFR